MNEYLNMIKGDRVPLIKFDLLSNIPFIKHCFTTKLGGVSQGIFATMNLSFVRGDDEVAVRKNYEIVAGELGVKVENMVASHQTHTTNVLRVTKDDCGRGILKERNFSDIDGLVTDEKDVVLVTAYADCVPLYFVDVENKAIGLSHSGWRGTVNKMGKKTIEVMKKEFGTKPENLKCVIGPSICQECYEVSEDVYDRFREAFLPNELEQFFIKKNNGKYMLDLWKVNEIILIESGVNPCNIENRRLCTCCNYDILFSHRATAGKRGNMCAFLSIC